MYGTTCKTKCELLATTTCTSDDRVDDCYYVQTKTGDSGTCTNKVCVVFCCECIYKYMLLEKEMFILFYFYFNLFIKYKRNG
jgi:hypothetical protein